MGALNQNANFEPFEVVGESEHSQFLSVIVEGKDDVLWYPLLEKGALKKVNFKPLGGRDKVLACYRLAKERKSRKIVCVVDSDLWVIFGRPAGYDKLVLTEGYSIENDILKDSCIHSLFSEEEKQWLIKCKELLSVWFAFYAYTYSDQIDEKHQWPGVNHVLSFSKENSTITGVKISNQVVERYGFVRPSNEVVESVASSFDLKFRGKSLLQLYEIFLGRTTASRPGYNGKQLIDMSLRFGTPPPFQKRLVAEIKKVFAEMGVPLNCFE